MVRFSLRTALLLGSSCLCLATGAFAAVGSVQVRGGQHKEYSRIVFDWHNNVDYNVTRIADNVIDLRFNQSISADLTAANIGNLNFIDKIETVSSDPLQLRLTLSGEYKVKYFKLGNKFVFDALNQLDADAKTLIESSQVSQAPQLNNAVQDNADNLAEAVIEDVSQTEPSQDLLTPVSEPIAKQDIQLQEEAKLDIAADVKAINAFSDVLDENSGLAQLKDNVARIVKAKHEELKKYISPDLNDPEAENIDIVEKVDVAAVPKFTNVPKRKPVTSINPDSRRPNLILISTAKETAMAAFLLNDRLWLVNNDEAVLIKPDTMGSQIKDMEPLKFIENAYAKILTYKGLKGAKYDAQGGGYSWRFLAGNRPVQNSTSVDMEYRYNEDGKPYVFWSLDGADEIVDVLDPASGYVMKVVTVKRAGQVVSTPFETFDYKIMPSSLGLVIVPKVDDLIVKRDHGGIVIYRGEKHDLVLTDSAEYSKAIAAKQSDQRKTHGSLDQETVAVDDIKFLLDFESWQLGGVEYLSENRARILGTLPLLNTQGQVKGLMRLARMYISNGMGAEANGLLKVVEGIWPDIKKSPDYTILRGVSHAIRGHYEEAFEILSMDEIKDQEEVLYWRSYCLAHLHDWQQAISMLPTNFEYIHYYPAQIAITLGVTLTEVALRAGEVDLSNELFSILEDPNIDKEMRNPHRAALKYLKGEAARQDNRINDAIEIWDELANGDDDLYRVRAGVALTRLEQLKKDLSVEEALDKLERLRYAWRGDDLEAQVNFWLGVNYFDYGSYVKGLSILREAAAYAKSPYLAKRVINKMRDNFKDVFLSRKLYELSGPDVAALYEHFSELIPIDEDGDLMARRLADRLVQSHLYDRALELLDGQLARGSLTPSMRYDIMLRMAAIYQFNDDPTSSLTMLDKAKLLISEQVDLLSEVPVEITLLTARAYAQDGRAKEALQLLALETMTPQTTRLRADIAWQNSFWEDAAEALEQVISDEGIHADEHLSEEAADLVLRRAVALNLGGDRIRLANMRETYGKAMDETQHSYAFDVITRAHKNAEIADYETLQKVASEVEVFSDFMDNYRGGEFAYDE